MNNDILEIRWHSRAGQGAVIASKTLAQVIGLTGKYTQGFSEYGAEKRGAPVVSYNRLSPSPIRLHCLVENPSIVLVLDPSLIEIANITRGMNGKGMLILNSIRKPQELRRLLEFQDGQLYSLDATKIAMEEIGRDIPNSPMLGALMKGTNLMGIEEFLKKYAKILEKSFSPVLVKGNLVAAERGFNEVKKDE